MERQELENLALKYCCPCVYYELLDCMEQTTDEQLLNLITTKNNGK
jgi:hypothetical protein